jgi:hypothetical protein
VSQDGADEYLEEVLKDCFERELDVDENVARTLPFFAAAFAFAGPMFTYIIAELPPSGGVLGVVLRIMLAAAAVSACIVLGNLFRAVRRRDYKIPPSEPELVQYAKQLKEAYQLTGLTPKFVQLRTKEKLRELMVRHYADDTAHNRRVNAPKLKARAEGFTWLVIMLSIAFLMIGIMFVTDEVTELRKSERNDVAASNAKVRAQGQVRPEGEGEGAGAGGRQDLQQGRQGRGAEAQGQAAGGAAGSNADARRGAPANNALEPRAAERRPQVSDSDRGGGQQPAPAPQPVQPAPVASLPQPPSGQILKKSI